jgi:hypothetical protein
MLSFTQADPLEKKHCAGAMSNIVNVLKCFGYPKHCYKICRGTSGSSTDLKLLCPETEVAKPDPNQKNEDNTTPLNQKITSVDLYSHKIIKRKNGK